MLDALRVALGHAWQIDSQLPIALDDDSEPEPDVAVVPRYGVLPGIAGTAPNLGGFGR